MPDPVTGILAGTSVIGGVVQGNAASKASKAQTQSNDQAVAEQRRQFDQLKQLLSPYAAAGTPALQGLMDLAGLGQTTTNWSAYAQSNPELMAAYQAQQQSRPIPGNAGLPYGIGDNYLGPEAFMGSGGRFGIQAPGLQEFSRDLRLASNQPMSLDQFAQQYYAQNGGDISQFQNNPQAQAVARIEQQPMFQALARQGEDAILQNASATGGLRGGNTQGALARFRPQLLNQFIEQQYGRLAGLTQLGQNSAAGVGNAGLATGANIGQLLANSGQAQAAGIGAQGQIFGNTIGNLGGIFAGSLRPSAPAGNF